MGAAQPIFNMEKKENMKSLLMGVFSAETAINIVTCFPKVHKYNFLYQLCVH